MIAGGYNGACLNDVVLFDVDDQTITNITVKGKLKFQSLGNQSAQVSEDRVVALVQDKHDELHMTEINRGLDSILTNKTC